ncbi:MAG TPA: hypothetical protein VGP93_04210, partial [Polyangiaceae bacterium]|nr:hypothetical protein [Polyangiaceae bacterium]
HKATLYVYDPKRVPIEQRLQQQMVRNKPVFVGSERGFSIAARANRGVGYALASDLDEPESAELIAGLDSP